MRAISILLMSLSIAVLAVNVSAALGAPPLLNTSTTLPDGRAYELVSPPDKNGVTPGTVLPAPDGDTVDWQGTGGCCGSTTGGNELYQSRRGPTGWTTTGLTPVPSHPLEGLFEAQLPVFWSTDLTKTIYSTAEAYDAGDADGGAVDLYLQTGAGAPLWLSRGPFGGEAHDVVTFDAATPDANTVVFNTTEQLTANAVGLSEQSSSEYLYARDVADGSTQLLNVTNAGTLLDPGGAVLGAGSFVGEAQVPPNQYGSTTNAISRDGSKAFMESPWPGYTGTEGIQTHLYMRDLANGTTTPLDDLGATGMVRFEGAAEDGSLVFFTSTEGIAGDPNTDPELYEFNTTSHAIGPAPAMSAIPVSAGDAGGPALDGRVVGVSAIANDGSHVYFVAEGLLTSAPNGRGQTATENAPNLNVFDTATGRTAFVAPLDWRDAYEQPGVGKGPLTTQPDIQRPAIPTPDGNVLVFRSSADIAGDNPEGPTTTLLSEAPEQTKTLSVESTEGFLPGRVLELGEPGGAVEKDEVVSVAGPNELRLSRALRYNHEPGQPVTQLPVEEIYRYGASDGSLACISCPGPGVTPMGIGLITGGGGSYAPPGFGPQMSADGSRIFFMTEEPLVPEDENGRGLDIYEWEDGHLYLISNGRAPFGAYLFSTTPSGDDVFFSTPERLVPQDTDGYFDTYDARVGGGFPPATTPPESCTETGCRNQGSPSPTLSMPGSELLSGISEGLPTVAPTFSVRAVGSARRAGFARTGKLALTVDASADGRVTVRATALLGGKRTVVASAGGTIEGAPGHSTLTLRLSPLARRTLARRRRLAVQLEVAFSSSTRVETAQLVLVRGGSSSHGTPGRSAR